MSTGACIGHVGPEGLAGGPIGKLVDDDWIEIVIDRHRGEASLNLIGDQAGCHDVDWGNQQLETREVRDDLREANELPAATRLWAALQAASGGTWGGCVFDVDAILARLKS